MAKPAPKAAYWLTLFRIEGHDQWRAHLGGHEQAFAIESGKWANAPKIITKKVIRVDRITGELDIK